MCLYISGTVAYLGGSRGHVKNGISNLYILLKSALKMQEMLFQRPKFETFFERDMPPDPLTIVSSLWPPPHCNPG